MIFFSRFLRYFPKIRTSPTLKKSHGYYKYLSQELSDRISLLPYDFQVEIESRVMWLLPKHVGCIYTWQHEKSWELKVTFHGSDVPIEINWRINVLSFEKRWS